MSLGSLEMLVTWSQATLVCKAVRSESVALYHTQEYDRLAVAAAAAAAVEDTAGTIAS
jgi:hypothetical protein